VVIETGCHIRSAFVSGWFGVVVTASITSTVYV